MTKNFVDIVKYFSNVFFLLIFSGGPFEFNIPGSSQYTVLPLTRLHGTCQIVKKDGSILSDDVDYSIVNLFPHAIFSQLDLEIDGFNLTSHDNLYLYKAYP